MNYSSIYNNICSTVKYSLTLGSAIPAVGPFINSNNSWSSALDQSTNQLFGISGGLIAMFSNAAWGVNLMETGFLARFVIMSSLMEIGSKGGNLSYSLLKVIKECCEQDPQYKELFRHILMRPSMEIAMYIGGLIGMFWGMNNPLFDMSDNEYASALDETGNMALPMLIGMTGAMVLEKAAYDCFQNPKFRDTVSKLIKNIPDKNEFEPLLYTP